MNKCNMMTFAVLFVTYFHAVVTSVKEKFNKLWLFCSRYSLQKK